MLLWRVSLYSPSWYPVEDGITGRGGCETAGAAYTGGGKLSSGPLHRAWQLSGQYDLKALQSFAAASKRTDSCSDTGYRFACAPDGDDSAICPAFEGESRWNRTSDTL